MSENVKEAIRLTGIYTGYTYNLWALAGNAKAGCRAHIMSALVGKRMPQSKSGVTALRSALYSTLGIDGTCIADEEEKFKVICKAMKPS